MQLLSTFLVATYLPLMAIPYSADAEPTIDLPETRVVLRISREFIYELTRQRFQKDVPVSLISGNAVVQGTANAEGTTDIEIQASENACSFDLIVRGNVTTRLVASTGGVQLRLHGDAPFTASRRVLFEDVAFTARRAEVATSYHSTIEGICAFQGGLIGAVKRGVASSTARWTIPGSDLQAGEEVRARLIDAIDSESDGLLITLNKVGAIVKEGEQLLRDEKLLSSRSVQHYLAATPRSLYISLGPPGHRIAKLPRLTAPERQPIELWVAIRKPGKVDRFSSVLANWKLVKPFILPRIAERSPEAAKLLDQVEIRKVQDWHVLTFAPELLKSL